MMTDTVPPTVRAFVRPCRACGRPILWTRTIREKAMPVDPAPNPDGNQAVYRDGTGTFRSRVPTDELPVAPHEQLHMPHMATCDERAPSSARTPATPASPTAPSSTSPRERRRRRPQPPLLEI